MQPKIKWHEVTWYSKLGAALLLLGIVPALCFYVGRQYEAVTVSYSHIPELSGLSSKITPHSEQIDYNCSDSGNGSTMDINECLEKKSDALRTSIRLQYKQISETLMRYTIEEAEGRADLEVGPYEFFRTTQAKLSLSEKSADDFIASYCGALVNHFDLLGGTISGSLYGGYVVDALRNEQMQLKNLLDKYSDVRG